MCFIVFSVRISFQGPASLDQSDVWNMAALCFFLLHAMWFSETFVRSIIHASRLPTTHTLWTACPWPVKLLVIFTFHSKLECIALLNVWTTTPTQNISGSLKWERRLFISTSESIKKGGRGVSIHFYHTSAHFPFSFFSLLTWSEKIKLKDINLTPLR